MAATWAVTLPGGKCSVPPSLPGAASWRAVFTSEPVPGPLPPPPGCPTGLSSVLYTHTHVTVRDLRCVASVLCRNEGSAGPVTYRKVDLVLAGPTCPKPTSRVAFNIAPPGPAKEHPCCHLLRCFKPTASVASSTQPSRNSQDRSHPSVPYVPSRLTVHELTLFPVMSGTSQSLPPGSSHLRARRHAMSRRVRE